MVTLSMETDVFSNVQNLKIILEIIVSVNLTIITQPLEDALHAHLNQDQMPKEHSAFATKDLCTMKIEDVLKKEF